MPLHRFYLPEPLAVSTVTLEGVEHHHIRHVMRLRKGDSLELINGRGGLAKATLLEFSSTATEVAIQSVLQTPPPEREFILAQAIIKPSLLDWVIEKGTELGAAEFWLFPGDRSEREQLSEHQRERFRLLTISALKQSGRLYLPSIHLKPELTAWERSSHHYLFGSLQATTPMPQQFKNRSVVCAIGPEPGWSPEEESFLETALHATAIRLSHYTLRAETAAVCALSQGSWLVMNQ